MEDREEKLVLYIDTSVLSNLDADDAPEQMSKSLIFWEDVKIGKYKIRVSSVVFEEVNACPEPKRQFILDKLGEIEYLNIEINDDIRAIANELLKIGTLGEKQENDRVHIGSAVYGKCDFIVSWNFKHLVRGKTIKGVHTVTEILGYESIDIVSPESLVETEGE
jgi:hypothetical protein